MIDRPTPRPGEELSGNEIEITPEMIAAGLSEFLDFDSRFEHDYRELVTRIYEAMERTKIAGHPVREAAHQRGP